MKKFSITLLLAATIILTACAPAAREVYSEAMLPVAEAMPAAPMNPAEFSKSADSMGNAFSDGAAPAASMDRLVIKNASISVIVKDPTASLDNVAMMAEEYQGWVVSSNLYKVTTDAGIEIPQASITIRVPAAKLNDVLTKIKAEVDDPKTDVRSENVSGEDVTSQYTDLQSRKANLEQAEASLREIMASATKTEDVIVVFNQLTQIRGEIEVLKGQIKYYEESSSYSAISVEIISQATIKPLTVAGWQPQGDVRNAVQALIDALKFLVKAIIWVVIYIFPILLVLYLFVRLVIWIIKKLFFGKKAKVVETKAVTNPTPPAEGDAKK